MARYWVGGGSSTNWAAVTPTNWAASSGGAGDATVPSVTEDVFFDASSGASTTVVAANISVKTLTCTGYTGNITITNTKVLTIAGNALFVSGMTLTIGGTTSAITLTNATTGNTLTTGGITLPKLNISYTANGASCVLQDNLICGVFTVTRGVFNANNKNVTCSSLLDGGGASVKVFTLGSGTWTILANDELSQNAIFISGTNNTWNYNTSTIVINNPPTTSKFLWMEDNGSGSSLSIYNLVLNGNASSVSIVIQVAPTIVNSVIINGPNKISFDNSATWLIQGTFTKTGGLVTFTATTPGNTYTFDGNGQTITLSGLSLTDSAAINGTWRATNSYSGGGNSGWTITPPLPINLLLLNVG